MHLSIPAALMAALLLVPGFVAGTGDPAAHPSHAPMHYAPPGPFDPTPVLDTSCTPVFGPIGQGTHLVLEFAGEVYDLLVEGVDQSPDALLTVDADAGGVGTVTEESNILFLEGSVVGGGAFFLTASPLGLDGGVTTADGRSLDLSPAGTSALETCAAATVVPFRDIPNLPLGFETVHTSNIDVLVMLDSAFYSTHSCYTCVASNIFNRARNAFSGEIGQAVTLNKYVVSTSTSTDSSLGMTSSGLGLDSWATTTSGRSDKSDWDLAVLMRGLSGTGSDGQAYLAGRYAVVMTEYTSHSTYSTNYYHYNGMLLAHEMGHDFGADHPSGSYYNTYADSCDGIVDQPSQNNLCIGYSSNCTGTKLPLTSAGRDFCVGSSPPKYTGRHYYIMASAGYHDPANQVYWEPEFKSTSKTDLNNCLHSWHSISYTKGDKSC